MENINSGEEIREEKITKVYGSYDVIIVGGGVSGVGAAISAGREGMKTLLIEKAAYMGGLSTLGHVCWYLPLCDGNGRKVIGGISEELLHASIRYGYDDLPEGWTPGIDFLENPKGRYKTWFNIPAFVLVLDELVKEAGVDMLFDTVFAEPIMEGSQCCGVIVENKSGRCAYRSRVVIDATGDADVMYRAGAECFERTTILSYWCYDTDFDKMKKAIENQNMLEAVHMRMLGALPKVVPDKNNPGKSRQSADTPYREYYGTDAKEVSEYLLASRQVALEYLKKNQRSDYTMLSVPAMGDFRTTRRITGQYELCPEDIYKSFDDSIGCTGDWRKAGPIYEIPYRSLLDKKIKNILAVGRIIASRDDAWEVTRVIPPAVMTGEAAGAAASLAVKQDLAVDEINIGQLQQMLSDRGVIIHQ